MRFLKIFALTLYFFIGILIPACNFGADDDLNCNCGSSKFFDVMDLQVDPVTDFGSLDFIPSGEQLNLAEFGGFYVDYIADYHACVQPKNNWSLSTMSSAFACSCLFGYEGSKSEALVDFTVTTVNDFDADHLAGSPINDLLQYEGSFWDENNLPLTDFLTMEQEGNLSVEDMRLSLLKAPEIDSVLQVQVRMELSTGEVYEASSATIILLP